MLTILYFGRLSERAQRRQVSVAMPASVTSISTLKDWLNAEHHLGGALADPSVKTMVNQTLAHSDLTLKGDEEIGFLPPVGGG